MLWFIFTNVVSAKYKLFWLFFLIYWQYHSLPHYLAVLSCKINMAAKACRTRKSLGKRLVVLSLIEPLTWRDMIWYHSYFISKQESWIQPVRRRTGRWGHENPQEKILWVDPSDSELGLGAQVLSYQRQALNHWVNELPLLIHCCTF